MTKRKADVAKASEKPDVEPEAESAVEEPKPDLVPRAAPFRPASRQRRRATRNL